MPRTATVKAVSPALSVIASTTAPSTSTNAAAMAAAGASTETKPVPLAVVVRGLQKTTIEDNPGFKFCKEIKDRIIEAPPPATLNIPIANAYVSFRTTFEKLNMAMLAEETLRNDTQGSVDAANQIEKASRRYDELIEKKKNEEFFYEQRKQQLEARQTDLSTLIKGLNDQRESKTVESVKLQTSNISTAREQISANDRLINDACCSCCFFVKAPEKKKNIELLKTIANMPPLQPNPLIDEEIKKAQSEFETISTQKQELIETHFSALQQIQDEINKTRQIDGEAAVNLQGEKNDAESNMSINTFLLYLAVYDQLKQLIQLVQTAQPTKENGLLPFYNSLLLTDKLIFKLFRQFWCSNSLDVQAISSREEGAFEKYQRLTAEKKQALLNEDQTALNEFLPSRKGTREREIKEDEIEVFPDLPSSDEEASDLEEVRQIKLR